MTSYQIIETGERRELQELVNLALEHGWKPLGGVAVGTWPIEDERKGTHDTGWVYLQAMVR